MLHSVGHSSTSASESRGRRYLQEQSNTAGQPAEKPGRAGGGSLAETHLKLLSTMTSVPLAPITRYCLLLWTLTPPQVAFFRSSTCAPALTASKTAKGRREQEVGLKAGRAPPLEPEVFNGGFQPLEGLRQDCRGSRSCCLMRHL